MGTRKAVVALIALVLVAVPALSDSVPKPLRTRLVIGDPVRESLRGEYPKVWSACVNSLLENLFQDLQMKLGEV